MLRPMYKPFQTGLLLLLVLRPRVTSRKVTPVEMSTSPPQRLLKCDDARVVYTPLDKAYSQRIIFKSVSDSENPPENARKEYSPQRNMWMAVAEADISKPGPHNTNIYYGSNANEEVWKLTFIDYVGDPPKWLSEKLVFGQVWWGRIYATEFVIDLQQHKFLYREMANYGAMTEPCE
jgi:hypothetical protein